MTLFNELKRRNVFRVGIAYIVIAWLLAQVADLAFENFGTPDWAIKTLLFVLVMGFPLALFFAWAFELTPEGLKKEKEVDRTQSITHHTGRKLDFVIIGILIVALGYFAFDKFVLTPPADTEVVASDVVDPEPAAEEAVAEPDRSIAVLPFADMSPDKDQEYFSDGISEEILNSLARVKELKVAGRTSSFSFKDKNVDLRTIGSALGVAHILEGSIRKSGNTLRITAQLIKVDDGFHMWSETYDRELTDVFAIQDEIAGAILEQMKLQLIDGEDSPQIASTRADLEAYSLYLLAKQNIYTRKLDALELAARLLDQAIGIDPTYAPAYAQRGIAELLLSDSNYGTVPRIEAWEKGKQLLDKSIELDSRLAEGYAGLGLYYIEQRGMQEQSVDVLRKALSINPSMVNASNWLQTSLGVMGELAASGEIVEQILERDPLYRPAIGNAQLHYYLTGQDDKYKALVDRTKLYLPGDKRVLGAEGGFEFWVNGNLAVGLRLLEASWQVEKNDQVSTFRFGFALAGTGQWERLLELGLPFQKVYALQRLGRPEEAGILAREHFANTQGAGTILNYLIERHEYEAVVALVDENWPDLDEFELTYPEKDGFGATRLLNIAFAYLKVNRDVKFKDALGRIKASHAQQIAQGANNALLSFSLAYQAMLESDEAEALNLLDKARSQGFVQPTRISTDTPAFAPLSGHPWFEKLHEEMLAQVNTERAKLDLAPLQAESYL